MFARTTTSPKGRVAMTPQAERTAVDHSHPRLVAMSDDDTAAGTRGEAIKRRRLGHGIKSLREFADKTGVSREAITNAEEGLASSGTYDRLEAWLDSYEHAISSEREDLEEAAQVIEIHILGLYGVEELVIKAPPSESERAQEMAVELLRRAAARQRRDDD